jgi:glucose/arabinose dehydrogenase
MQTRLRHLLIAGAIPMGLAATWLSSPAATQEPARFARAPNILQTPAHQPVDERLLRRLQVPDGFRVSIFASPGGNTRIMAAGPGGIIYVTRQEEGDVLALRDLDGDGRAEETRTVASGLDLVHGIAVHEGVAYLVSPTTVWAADVAATGDFAAPRAIIEDLPDGGQHRARTIAVGPDGRLYISVGSTCNACLETNPRNATMQRADLDGSNLETFATGLRHTVGFAWNPHTADLWGWDHGSDSRGNNTPPEELNRIVKGGNYGWPFCFADRRVDRLIVEAPKGTTREAYCAATQPPAATNTAHSAPMAFVFYQGSQFPGDYQGDAFVAFRGSWNRTPPSGYKVMRVRFANGEPVATENFLTGFLSHRPDGPAHYGRLVGLLVAADGSLLVSDDANGIIYRVSYP